MQIHNSTADANTNFQFRLRVCNRFGKRFFYPVCIMGFVKAGLYFDTFDGEKCIVCINCQMLSLSQTVDITVFA